MVKGNEQITVEGYLAALPSEAREAMEELRGIIRKTAPKAEELISYQMPAYKYHGMLMYIGAAKNHYSLFPGNSTLIKEQFEQELSAYDVSKGTIRFSYDQPLPVELIKKIVLTRMAQNEAAAQLKAEAKTAKKVKK